MLLKPKKYPTSCRGVWTKNTNTTLKTSTTNSEAWNLFITEKSKTTQHYLKTERVDSYETSHSRCCYATRHSEPPRKIESWCINRDKNVAQSIYLVFYQRLSFESILDMFLNFSIIKMWKRDFAFNCFLLHFELIHSCFFFFIRRVEFFCFVCTSQTVPNTEPEHSLTLINQTWMLLLTADLSEAITSIYVYVIKQNLLLMTVKDHGSFRTA